MSNWDFRFTTEESIVTILVGVICGGYGSVLGKKRYDMLKAGLAPGELGPNLPGAINVSRPKIVSVAKFLEAQSSNKQFFRWYYGGRNGLLASTLIGALFYGYNRKNTPWPELTFPQLAVTGLMGGLVAIVSGSRAESYSNSSEPFVLKLSREIVAASTSERFYRSYYTLRNGLGAFLITGFLISCLKSHPDARKHYDHYHREMNRNLPKWS